MLSVLGMLSLVMPDVTWGVVEVGVADLDRVETLCVLPDVDGDGVRDIVAADPGAARHDYAWMGDASGGHVVAISAAAGDVLWASEGAAGEHFGWSLALIHDVDADGVRDVAIGAPGRAGIGGSVYIVSPADGHVIRHLEGPSGFGASLAYDSSSGRLAIGMPGPMRGGVNVVDRDFAPSYQVSGGPGFARSICFVPAGDGGRMALALGFGNLGSSGRVAIFVDGQRIADYETSDPDFGAAIAPLPVDGPGACVLVGAPEPSSAGSVYRLSVDDLSAELPALVCDSVASGAANAGRSGGEMMGWCVSTARLQGDRIYCVVGMPGHMSGWRTSPNLGAILVVSPSGDELARVIGGVGDGLGRAVACGDIDHNGIDEVLVGGEGRISVLSFQ